MAAVATVASTAQPVRRSWARVVDGGGTAGGPAHVRGSSTCPSPADRATPSAAAARRTDAPRGRVPRGRRPLPARPPGRTIGRRTGPLPRAPATATTPPPARRRRAPPRDRRATELSAAVADLCDGAHSRASWTSRGTPRDRPPSHRQVVTRRAAGLDVVWEESVSSSRSTAVTTRCPGGRGRRAGKEVVRGRTASCPRARSHVDFHEPDRRRRVRRTPVARRQGRGSAPSAPLGKEPGGRGVSGSAAADAIGIRTGGGPGRG